MSRNNRFSNKLLSRSLGLHVGLPLCGLALDLAWQGLIAAGLFMTGIGAGLGVVFGAASITLNIWQGLVHLASLVPVWLLVRWGQRRVDEGADRLWLAPVCCAGVALLTLVPAAAFPAWYWEPFITMGLENVPLSRDSGTVWATLLSGWEFVLLALWWLGVAFTMEKAG